MATLINSGTLEEEHEEDERRRRPHRHEEQQELNLDLGDPHDVLRTDGGAMRMWSQNVGAIHNMAIGVAELELQENGLLLPVYTDVPKIGYVTQGWLIERVFDVQTSILTKCF